MALESQQYFSGLKWHLKVAEAGREKEAETHYLRVEELC